VGGVSALVAGALLGAGGASANNPAPACASRGPHGMHHNPWPPAQHRLAPHGAQAIQLCRYSGSNGHPAFGLVRSRGVFREARIHRMVGLFDALKPAPSRAFSCPADDGSQIVATLFYREHAVQISVTLSGCETASNGDLMRAAFNFDGHNPAGPKLVAQLKRLTRG
jgi:hypothetical protein